MPDCEVIRSTTVSLDKAKRWNIKLDFEGIEPFNRIELEDKLINKVSVKHCKFYDGCEEAMVVVFSLVDK